MQPRTGPSVLTPVARSGQILADFIQQRLGLDQLFQLGSRELFRVLPACFQSLLQIARRRVQPAADPAITGDGVVERAALVGRDGGEGGAQNEQQQGFQEAGLSATFLVGKILLRRHFKF